MATKQYSLKDTVRKLEEFIPLKYAESWDNVGLLTEPTKIQTVQKCLLTIDLTTAVLEEAIANKVDLIISYHPPLFQSFKRLTTRDTKENIAIKCIENQIAIWSPHSALDSVPDGINDYLASIMGEGITKPLQYFQDKSDSIRVTISNVKKEEDEEYKAALDKLLSTNSIYKYSITESTIECLLSKRYLDKLYEGLLSDINNNNKTSSIDIVSIDKLPQFNAGSGRLVTLKNPTTLAALSNNIKDKLNLKNLRIATPWQHKGNLETVKIQSIAICAGSGKSVFGRCKADLLFTGELDHHFVLSSIESGSSVICTEHSNSERGYLPYLKQKLDKLFENSIAFIVSTEDRDPLSVY